MEKANAQTQIIERDLSKLSQRFDRHLEIYAQNGKELAALKSSVDALARMTERNNDVLRLDQSNQWSEIRDGQSRLNTIEINISKMAVKIGLFASLGSAATSGIVLFLIERILV